MLAQMSEMDDLLRDVDSIVRLDPPDHDFDRCQSCLSKDDVKFIVIGFNSRTTSIKVCDKCLDVLSDLILRR